MTFPSLTMYFVELIFVAFLIVAVRAVAGRRLGPGVRRLLWVLLILKALVPLTIATPYHPLGALANLNAPTTPVSTPEPEPAATPIVQPERPAGMENSLFAILPPEAVLSDDPIQLAAAQPAEPAQTAADAEPPGGSVAAAIATALPAVWLLGAVVLLGVAVWRNRTIIRVTTRDPVAVPDWVRDIFLDCREQLALRRTPELIVSPCVPSPCLVGVIRPRVLIPERLVEQRTLESQQRIRHLLLHELTHLKQGDVWLAWLWTLALAVQWFNPLFWLLGRHVRFDCEAACDDRVLTTLAEHERPDYGTNLLHILIDTTSRHATPRFAPGFLGLAQPRSNLERRLTMMNAHRMPSWPRRLAACVVFLLLGALCVTSYGQSKPPAATPEEETPKAEATTKPASESNSRFTAKSRKALLQQQKEYNERRGKLESDLIIWIHREKTLEDRRDTLTEEEYDKERQAVMEAQKAAERKLGEVIVLEHLERRKQFPVDGIDKSETNNIVYDHDAFQREVDLAAMEDEKTLSAPMRRALLQYFDDDGDGKFSEAELRAVAAFIRELEKPLRHLRKPDIDLTDDLTPYELIWEEWTNFDSRLKWTWRNLYTPEKGAQRMDIATAFQLFFGQLRYMNRLAEQALAANGGKHGPATRAAIVKAFTADVHERFKKADVGNKGNLDVEEWYKLHANFANELLKDVKAEIKPATQPARADAFPAGLGERAGIRWDGETPVDRDGKELSLEEFHALMAEQERQAAREAHLPLDKSGLSDEEIRYIKELIPNAVSVDSRVIKDKSGADTKLRIIYSDDNTIRVVDLSDTSDEALEAAKKAMEIRQPASQPARRAGEPIDPGDDEEIFAARSERRLKYMMVPASREFYLRYFDADGDGKLDREEWKALTAFTEKFVAVAETMEAEVFGGSDNRREEIMQRAMPVFGKAMQAVHKLIPPAPPVEGERPTYTTPIGSTAGDVWVLYLLTFEKQALADNGGKPGPTVLDALVKAFEADMRERIKKAGANTDGKLGPDEAANLLTELFDELGLLNEDPPETKPAARQPASAPAAEPTSQPVAVPPDIATRQKLQRPVAAVDFNEQPLEKVIGWLRDATEANIVVNWKALEAVGVEKNTPVTLPLRNVSFETVLKNVLKVAGEPTMPLAYEIDKDGVIGISYLRIE